MEQKQMNTKDNTHGGAGRGQGRHKIYLQPEVWKITIPGEAAAEVKGKIKRILAQYKIKR